METLSIGQYDLIYNAFSFGFATLAAATLFFWLGIGQVKPQFKTALVVTGLVTFIAAYHYFRIGQSWSDAGPLHDGDGRGIFSDGQLNGGLQKHHAPHQGRLVVTRELSYGPEPAVLPTPRGFKNTAGVVFSDDGGKTWSAGAPMPPPFEEGEAAVAPRSCRRGRGGGGEPLRVQGGCGCRGDGGREQVA